MQVLDQYEVPVGMMRELQSVLTLRQEDKEKRRQQRKKKKRHRNDHSIREQVTGHAQNMAGISDTKNIQDVTDDDADNAQNASSQGGADSEHAQNYISQAVTPKDSFEEDQCADEGGVTAGITQVSQGVNFSPFTPHSLSEQLKSAILQRRNVSKEETFS